jgi:hypothetical protein
MSDQASTQLALTFDVGGDVPDTAILRLSGGVVLQRQLAKGDEIHLQVVNMDGETVADGYGRVVSVMFKDKLNEHGQTVSTERVHGIKVS